VRAARPITALDSVWVGVTDGGGMVQLVDPQTLTTVTYPDWTSPASGYYTAGYGSVWTYDWSSGQEVRWSPATGDVPGIKRVTEATPAWGGPCLTSIAAGAGAIWARSRPRARIRVKARRAAGCVD
jgi:hypothetical protein